MVDVNDRMRILMKLFMDSMFNEVPSTIPKYIGDVGSKVMLFFVIKNASKNTMGKVAKELNMSLRESIEEFYKSFSDFGMPFEYEISEAPLRITVKRCPLEEYVKRNRLACLVCLSMLAGIIEGVTGKKVSIASNVGNVGDRKAEIKIVLEKFRGEGYDECKILIKD